MNSFISRIQHIIWQKSILLIPVISCLFNIKVNAQYLTAVKDTSFTVYSSWQKIKKVYPEISLPDTAVKDSVRTIRNITYCKVGDHFLKLDIFFPAKMNSQKLPAVLIIHGGGWRSGDRSMHIPMAEKLAAKGYITLTVEYRLSTEALYPAAVNDLKTAVRWIRENAENYHIDGNKIAVWGFSSGGQLASLVGTTGNDQVQAIVNVDGVLAFLHPESGEGDDLKKTSAATYWFGSSKTERPDLWEQASALNHVNSSTPAILFLNSSVSRMHAGRNDMIRKLNGFHIYNEVHTFENSPHTFILFNPWFDIAADLTVKFLDKVLKNTN